MPEVSKTRRDQLVYRLSQDQKAIHSRLKNLNPDLGLFFLKPREDDNFLIWEIENREVMIHSRTDYKSLNNQQLEFVHSKLEKIKELVQSLGEDIRIMDFPSKDCIKLLHTNKGDLVVLDSWGFLPFDMSKGVNIIDILSKPKLKTIEADMQCLYYDESPASGEEVVITNNGFQTIHQLGHDGKLFLGKHIGEKRLTIKIKDKLDETILLNSSSHFFKYTIPYYTDVNVNIIDDNTGERKSNYSIKIKGKNIDTIISSDNAGNVLLSCIEAGNHINISDAKSNITYHIQKTGNNVDFRVKNEIIHSPVEPEVIPEVTPDVPPTPEPELKDVFFTVYGLKGEVLSDFELGIKQNDKLITTNVFANDSSKRYVSSALLNMKMRSRGIVRLDEVGKINSYSCKFTTKPNIYEYSFQIKKTRHWLWLLWLIPFVLALLITFDKDVDIKLEDEKGSSVSGASVNMKYTYASLFSFDTHQFFTMDSVEVNCFSDSLGMVSFKNNPTTVFDLVFHLRRAAKVNVMSNSDCYEPTGALIKFYKIWQIHEIEVQTKKTDFKLNVKELNEDTPIEGADVSIIIDGKAIVLTTDKNGSVLFPNLEVCNSIQLAYAAKTYPDFGTLQSDTLTNKTVNGANNLTLYIDEPEPCVDIKRQGGMEGEKILLATPIENNNYRLIYDFFAIQDRLLIYSYPDGSLIHDTGYRSGVGVFSFKPNELCNGCKAIFIQIETYDNGTSWIYNFKCN